MRVLRLVGAAVVIVGCGGGGDGGGGTSPPPAVSSVQVTASATSTSICGNVTLNAQPRDAQGGALSKTVSWETNPGSILSLSSNAGTQIVATGADVGTTNVTARSDNVPSTPVAVIVAGGQAPVTRSVTATATNTFSPTCVDVASGGSVTWTFAAEHNVIFGTSKPTGGDIDPTASGSVSRTFPTAGAYRYTCTLHAAMNGIVVVR